MSNISGAGAITAINTSSGIQTFTQNTVNNLTGSGTGGVVGMSSTGGTTQTFSRNKVYGISNTNAGGSANGIFIQAGTTTNLQNNIVGDITAPNLNATNSLNGINIFGGTTVTADFNTVHLNASSVGTNFGSSALNASSTPNVTLRNNVLVNTSTAAGTGLTVAYRRSSATLTTYNAASNNNGFYAGTPSATNLIFNDATNSDQTIAAYKARVASRDSASFSENPPFLSTVGTNANFLHINPATPTQLESGGIPVAGITDDFDGNTRNVSTPDVGADEGAFTLLDLVAPSISYTALLNTSSTSNRVLTTTITDASGVAGGALAPRIYFRKNAEAYFSTQCSGSSPTYTCTIDYSLVGGGTVMSGDVIQYFVVAQDVAGNVGANPSGGFTATNVNSVTTPPTTPSQYTIVAAISGSFNVGTGETYTSLTNAGGIFEYINNNEVTGNITINITSDLTGELGTNALNQFTSPHTILIRPSVAARSITGAAASTALIRINGASGVTIDGSTSGGTDRSLTITNTSVTSPSVVRFGSIGTTPITNDTLKNCIIINGVNTSSAVTVLDTAGSLAGYFTNLTIQNNDIRTAFVGIFANAIVQAGNGSGYLVTGNKLDNSGATAIRNVGVYVQGADGATVSNNSVGNFNTADGENDTGIWFATGTVNSTISGNTVTTLGYTGTSTFTTYGIRDNGGATVSGNSISQNTVSGISSNGTPTSGPTVIGIENSSGGTTIQRNNVQGIVASNTGTYGATGINISAGNNAVVKNNFVSNVSGDMTGGAAFSTTFGIFGLRVGAGTGHQIYNNSVNLYGARSGTATTSLLTAAIGVVSTASTGMDIRNNIFANNITGGTTSIANVSAYLPSGGTSAMNLTWNNNSYYFGTDVARAGAGQAGTTAGTNFYTTLSALAAYTSTLSPAATNDNASLSSTGAVPFTSANDLHVSTGAAEIDTGATIASVTNDFDGQSRPFGAAYDIGADEITPIVTYTVAYDANGGTGSQTDPNSPYASGSTVTVLGTGTIARTGYTFANWNTAANGSGTSYAPSATFSIAANTTLYAQWTINSYTVTFNGNGSDGGATALQTNNYNTVAALTSNGFTRTGYTFAGWNTLAGGGGTAYADGANYTFTADITLYAQWTINTYTLNYAAGANGSLTGNTSQNVNYGGSGTAVTAVPDSGYQFVNWSDSSTANPRTDTNVTGNISVTANFTADVCYAPPIGMTSWFKGENNGDDVFGHNAVAVNGAGYGAGKVGQAFSLNGSNQYYESTPDSPDFDFGTGNLSIDAWISPVNTAGIQRIVSAGIETGSPTMWTFGYGDGWGGGTKLNFAFWNGSGYVDYFSNAITLNPNQWYHVAVVRSGSTITFYLNGTVVGSSSPPLATINGGTTGLVIGARRNTTFPVYEFANGKLDEIEIFHSALSAGDILGIYNASTAGKCPLPTYTLTVNANPVAGGATTPSGATTVSRDVPKAISATANPGYAFVNWTSSDAGVTFADANAANTDVELTSGSATIQANFAPTGTVQFSSGTYSVTEGTATVTLTATRTGGSSGAVTANYSLGGGTATGTAACGTPGQDYVNTGGSVSWANGDAADKTFNVTICNDAVYELSQTFGATLSIASGGATLGTPNPATVTINNDDSAPTIAIADVSQNEGDSGTTNFGFGIAVTGASEVSAGFSVATADGTATAPTDYSSLGTTAISAPADVNRTTTTYPGLVVSVNGDTMFESNETFFMNSSGCTDCTISDNQAIATITNDDGQPTVQFSAPTYNNNDDLSGGNAQGDQLAPQVATITVNRTGAAGDAFSVNYATVPGGSATAGASCTTGVDYISTSGTLSFAAGDTSKTFDVTVCTDSLFEGNETVNLAVTSPTAPVILGAQNTAVLNIIDNETVPTLQFNSATYNGNEGTSATITVTRTGGTANAVSVNYATVSGGSATAGTCGSGGDYVSTSGTFNFASGETSKTFNVSLCSDAVDDIAETVNLQLSAAGGGAVLGMQSTAVLTINNVDGIAPVIAPYVPLSATTNTSPRVFTVSVTDNVGVVAVTTYYSVNGGAPGTITCVPAGGNDWTCGTPGASIGDSVAYYVAAFDAIGNASNSPFSTVPFLYTVGAAAIPAGTYTGLEVVGGSTLGGNVSVGGAVNLGGPNGGTLDTGAFTLTIGCDGNIAGAGGSNYVIGTVEKQYCTTGAFTYPVGTTANGPLPLGAPAEYTPFTANVTALGTVPSSLTVAVVDGAPLANADPLQSVSRYWDVTETGDLTADITYQWLLADVTGTESLFKVMKRTGATTVEVGGGTVDSMTHTASLTGVTVFSSWSAGLLAPTAANALIEGRVISADGQGIRNATVMITGGGLSEPRYVQTGSFGAFRFDELPVGETYIVSVVSRRYVFANPTRAITLEDNVTDFNFEAVPR
ncbi:MAG: InlB B-repeat-containing protein [Acidobacteria bacterium]|nr:InlB B-repeat-containing protein [Acidobacteriota bacterium]